ncbi:aspartate kinase [Clostridium cylindrosporum]|uniref:Aspartokinase n=1 Tax=Clostridium cylindrosporum DSM 605 TaxID=1121307 RepID=A0A0J8DFW0_CLOCY|nr:aspartate kinase [Clostridium cylindrosporum]KMT23053.1 aspartokinase 1 [Clostridium cylindrosporum DSM 605]
MNILVQKFGGTSVATEENRELVANKIQEAKNNGYLPVVVVSAIGRKGAPYATDTLLSLINSKTSNVQREEKDLMMCCGEIISAVVLSEVLSKRKIETRVLTGGQAGILTDNNFGNAEILKVDPIKIYDLLLEGIVPIVTGFQGVTINNEFTTIGRGGSDTSATVLAEALKATAVEIYTDVDGIMTADPKIVSEAKVIDSISYSEVFQLADHGAKVIHPRAVAYALRGNIPIYIKNTMTNAKGTEISSKEEIKSNHIIAGVTHMPNRTQISIRFNEAVDNSNDLFCILAKEGISIDLINVFPQYKAFTIDDNDTEKVEKILKSNGYEASIIRNCSKVSLIGSGMKGIPGVMSKILKALNSEDVSVLQTADSHMTIWCLVNGNDTNKAINILHKIFNLQK